MRTKVEILEDIRLQPIEIKSFVIAQSTLEVALDIRELLTLERKTNEH